MSHPDDETVSGLPPKPSLWLRFLRLFARAPAPVPRASDARSQAASDLVDHAQAFKSLAVADVMTPRADIVAVELGETLDGLVAAFADSEHSRLPVYREDLDDPVGVVHLKDVFKLLAKPGGTAGSKPPVLASLMRQTLYVPPSMRAADLLHRMQNRRIHLAMVIDEFGGVDGLVTLEDVIESVVGEIDDEHDEASTVRIVPRGGGVFDVDARVGLDELADSLGRELATGLPDEDVDTVAGLVTTLAGRLPQRGEVIAHPDGFEFEVLDADPRRIKRLRIRPKAPVGAPAPATPPAGAND